MSTALQIGPGYDAPPAVTVHGQAWQVQGKVTGRAPYSVHVTYTPAGEPERGAWFVWEPGRPGHGKQHGVHPEFAVRVECES